MKKPKHSKIRKWFLRVVVICILIVLGWYTLSRATSPLRVISVADIEQKIELDQSDQTHGVLRVVAYNIAHGRGTARSNWSQRTEREQRLRDIGQLLRDNNADIVVLNEVDFASYWSGHDNQAVAIAEAGGFRYIAEEVNIDVSIPFVSLRFGNAVLSRYPIVEAEVIDLPGFARWETVLGGKKRALACIIALNEETRVRVVAAHLEPRGDETIRIESARKILDAIAGDDLPTIIAGDLNATLPDLPGARLDTSGRTSVAVFLQDGDLTATPDNEAERYAPTFPSWEPGRTIDWVLVSPSIDMTRLEVVQTDLSDHLPVVADVRLAQPTSQQVTD